MADTWNRELGFTETELELEVTKQTRPRGLRFICANSHILKNLIGFIAFVFA